MVALPPVELIMPAVALTDLVHVIRSKNAGPTLLTLDVFFRDRHGYERAIQSPQLSMASVAHLYGCAPERMSRYDMADLFEDVEVVESYKLEWKDDGSVLMEFFDKDGNKVFPKKA
jgi:hypothetical protein